MATLKYPEQHVGSGSEVRRQETMHALAVELGRIATQREIETLFRFEPPKEEPMATIKEDSLTKKEKVGNAITRSVEAGKFGLVQVGVDRVGRGAVNLAKNMFEEDSAMYKALDTPEGQQVLLGMLAFGMNIAAEFEVAGLETENIEWLTGPQIANTTRELAGPQLDKLLNGGQALLAYVQMLRKPANMADIIDMTRGALPGEVARTVDDVLEDVEVGQKVASKKGA